VNVADASKLKVKFFIAKWFELAVMLGLKSCANPFMG
jgi:hypothetical protein